MGARSGIIFCVEAEASSSANLWLSMLGGIVLSLGKRQHGFYARHALAWYFYLMANKRHASSCASRICRIRD